MMPESQLWPMSLHWGLHNFNLQTDRHAENYVAMIDQAYGDSQDLTAGCL